jgi:methionyl-tRNA formyltransferase
MARLAYLGTPALSVPPLRALAQAGHEIALCVTRPDRRRGRGSTTGPSPVKAAALGLGIPVAHDMEEVARAHVELAVVVAYGRIIPARLLSRVTMVNLHFSLLPRWRGAAPMERAILAGDRETGVCLMKIEEGLDTGPVYACRAVPLDDELTLDDLRTRLVPLACDIVVDALAEGVDHLPMPEPQQGEPTIAEKVTQKDLFLDWTEPARQLHRVVRLGRAWTTYRGKRLTVLEASVAVAEEEFERERGEGRLPGSLVGPAVTTGEGMLVLRRVQPESRSPMSADEWLRGVRPADGERLGTE